MNFADRVIDVIENKGPLVVGLDPHPEHLPPSLLQRTRGNGDDPLDAFAQAVFAFNRAILDCLRDVVGAVKVQMAFYEMLGPGGMKLLQRTLLEALHLGYLVILDGKRNDISSTAKAYASAYLSYPVLPGNQVVPPQWPCDALTVNPYLGEDGLLPFIEEAHRNEKGLFVLCRTSNPSAPFIQDMGEGETVYQRVATLVDRLGQNLIGRRGFSAIGVVVGATYPRELELLRKKFPYMLFLVPGIGAQEGDMEKLGPAFARKGGGTLVNVSRGIIFAYREGKDLQGENFTGAALERARFYQKRLRQTSQGTLQ